MGASNSEKLDRQLGRPTEEAEEAEQANEYDRYAEEFLELEAALRRVEGAEGAPTGTQTTGTVMAARRVSAIDVPGTYPRPIETPTALAIDVLRPSGDETTVYVEWPETFAAETPLARLLSGLDLSPDSFAELHGAELPLARIDGRYVLDPSPATNGTSRSDRWVYAIVTCLVGWSVAWLANPSGGLILLVWTLLPLATYFDLLYVREASDWSPRRYLWPLAMAVWVVNVPVGLFYLYKRVRALGPFWE